MRLPSYVKTRLTGKWRKSVLIEANALLLTDIPGLSSIEKERRHWRIQILEVEGVRLSISKGRGLR